MMEENILSPKGPRYGRRTGQWKLQPVSFKETIKIKWKQTGKHY